MWSVRYNVSKNERGESTATFPFWAPNLSNGNALTHKRTNEWILLVSLHKRSKRYNFAFQMLLTDTSCWYSTNGTIVNTFYTAPFSLDFSIRIACPVDGWCKTAILKLNNLFRGRNEKWRVTYESSSPVSRPRVYSRVDSDEINLQYEEQRFNFSLVAYLYITRLSFNVRAPSSTFRRNLINLQFSSV